MIVLNGLEFFYFDELLSKDVPVIKSLVLNLDDLWDFLFPVDEVDTDKDDLNNKFSIKDKKGWLMFLIKIRLITNDKKIV